MNAYQGNLGKRLQPPLTDYYDTFKIQGKDGN